MPTRIALRFAVATLLSCALVHCAPRQEPPAAPVDVVAPSGAVVGTPNPAMLTLLIKARAK
jgi:hypothetical protein